MPNPIPVCVLRHLVVDVDYAGKGIGSGLLKEAITKTLAFSQHIGVRALLVHALTERVIYLLNSEKHIRSATWIRHC